MSLSIPKKVPLSGFYYHYKHNPNGAVNNYAYEVVGVGFHTEGDARQGEEHFVVYRPLYDAAVYDASKSLGIQCFDNRPLEMWMGNVEKDGITIPRFLKIDDPQIIERLQEIKNAMY
jgi:hypothetical protein